MRRRFLMALLVAVGVAVAVAPSTMTAKAPPPSGTFTLSVGSTITFTNMHLNSQHRVMAMYCMGTGTSPEGWDCRSLGENGSSIGADMTLPDTSFTYPDNWQPWLTPTTTARLVLVDIDAEAAYFSDGTLWTSVETGFQAYTHATLGAKSGTTLVSINDGTENRLAEWQPALGAGKFNATVQVLPPKSTGVMVTNVTGYSDGATIVEGTPTCGFHTVVTYTADKKTKGAGVWTGLFDNGTSIGMTADPIAASPLTSTNIQVAAADLKLSSGYQFIVMVNGSEGDLLAFLFSSPFSLDPTNANWVNGCPPVGELVSTSWGS